MKSIRKAIFPVAGNGTRFLPVTKAMPKELLPIIDKPLIQYAVEEVVSAGIDTLIFVTGRNKRAIEDHFDRNTELENILYKNGKNDQANMLAAAKRAELRGWEMSAETTKKQIDILKKNKVTTIFYRFITCNFSVQALGYCFPKKLSYFFP